MAIRFVMKALPGKGWRIWNTKMKKWWGDTYHRQPDELITELNGERRPDVVAELTRKMQHEKRKL